MTHTSGVSRSTDNGAPLLPRDAMVAPGAAPPIANDDAFGDWVDVEVVIPPARPRIAPGVYEAVSTRLTRHEDKRLKRVVAVLEFDVFQGAISDGERLARLPMYLRLPGRKGLTATSKLSRLLHVAGVRVARRQRVALAVLRGKAWRVQVDDTKQDLAGNPAVVPYSVVSNVVELLTG